MSKKINVLNQNIANQIAAGEVAERPTLIIKELMENSIDAGAKSIRIFLKNSGFDEIRIIDNGEGIAKEEIATAFLRHATSKLNVIEDLNQLITMGFRGEALASISAVSKISVSTKTKEQDSGYKGILEGGEFIGLKAAPCNNGTEIVVENLFYNTPARKKFLATPTRELRDISDMVGKLIISHPNIAIELRNNNKKIFQSSGNGEVKPAIMSVYGRDIIKKLVHLDTEMFQGYISHPGFTKPSRSYYHFYINNRYIQSDMLNRSLEQAYHTLMPEHRFPVAFINISVDPSEYDINVHPNKLDVKFNKDAEIGEQLIKAVLEALLTTERAYAQDTEIINKVASPTADEPQTKPNHAVKPDKFAENKEKTTSNFTKFQSAALNDLMMLDKDYDANADETDEAEVGEFDKLTDKSSDFSSKKSTAADFKKLDDDDNLDFMLKTSLFKEKEELRLKTNFNEFTNKQKLDFDTGFYSSLMILGQLAASFIVATKEDALYLIDQHAAHERLLFNKIKKAVAEEEVTTQALLIPLEFITNYRQYAWIIENIIVLRDLGFIIEEFSDNSFIIREVPFWAQDINVIAFLEEFADGWLKQGGKLTTEKILESNIMLKACKSAIKANKYLDKSDIHYLFSELDLAEDAFTCPHGRPIAIKYSVEEIRRKFLRS
ncbi:MAG: DNA mismatch repair endonuclease MutL [Clostridiales bacterium]